MCYICFISVNDIPFIIYLHVDRGPLLLTETNGDLGMDM